MDAKRISIVIIIFLIIAGLIFWRSGIENNGPDKSLMESDTNDYVAKAVKEDFSENPRLESPGNHIGSSGFSEKIMEAYQCKNTADTCRYNPNVATSKEEAFWLYLHGYPTMDEMESIGRHSVDYYKKELARTNSQTAKSLYGMSLAENGDGRIAVGVLSEAATEGNIYALYALSTIYGGSSELGNLTTSAAYQRLAYLAGDAKAGDMYARRFGILTPPEHASADREAARMHQKLLNGKVYPRPL